MKATGIVRRIDDLGRVVVPKEIRRSLAIKEGDPLEIYTIDGGIVFKKYQPSDLAEIRDRLAIIGQHYEDYFSGVNSAEVRALMKEMNDCVKRLEELEGEAL